MRVKINDVVSSLGIVDDKAIGRLPDLVQDKGVPIQTKVLLKRIWKQIITAYSEYEEERKALLDTFGKRDETGELVSVNRQIEFASPQHKESFTEQHSALLDTVIEIIGERIKFPDQFSPRKMTEGTVDDMFSAMDLLKLEWLIDDGSGDYEEPTMPIATADAVP